MIPELTRSSPIGSRVAWSTIGVGTQDGILIDWDNGTAIVRLADGREVAVRCDGHGA
jgi:hypothetical protein